jgi:biotin operon repressor
MSADDFSRSAFRDGTHIVIDDRTPADALIESEEGPPPDPLERLTAGEVLDRLLDFLIGDHSASPTRALVIGTRIFCLDYALRPGVRYDSETRLADALGVTKAAISYHMRRLEDLTGCHFRGQKSVGARASYRRVQKGNRNGSKPTHRTRKIPAHPELPEADDTHVARCAV